MAHWTVIQWMVAILFALSIVQRPLVIGTIRTKEAQAFGALCDIGIAILLALGGFW